MLDTFLKLDGDILYSIQEYIRTPILTTFFIYITKLGDMGFVWIIVSLGLIIPKKTRKIGLISLLALLGSFIVNNLILKNLLHRVRPYDAISRIERLIQKPSDFSFPSGHTASSFAVASVFLRKLPRRYGIPAIILAALIGCSRLYLGVHYPTDVVFGMISGILISYLAEYIVGKIRRNKNSFF